jgi:hypothetical protein
MRLRELDADALARHAWNLFLYQGRTQLGARLIYRALELEPDHPVALRSLSDFLDQPGTEVLAAAVLEHAMATVPSPAFEELLFRARWWWGFAAHDSGSTSLNPQDFEDRGRFTLDEPRYRAFLADVGPVDSASRAAWRMVGVVSGMIRHRQKGEEVGLADLHDPAVLEPTAEYEQWLDSEPDPRLEGMERARQERRWVGPQDLP